MSQDRHQDRLQRWAKAGVEGTPPVHAATVILVRDGGEGLEALMLRRNSKIAFGGMWVFPGGRVDPGDCGSDDLGGLESARRAAVREAEEEAGVNLAADTLLAYAHWTPPPITPKRFLTWFFVAATPTSKIVIDGGEIHEHVWMRPADALARRDAGEIELAPPTWVSLFDLAQRNDVSDALAVSRTREPERFETHIAIESEGPTALWHGDAGWDEGNADAPGARHRLRMHGSRWRYERSS